MSNQNNPVQANRPVRDVGFIREMIYQWQLVWRLIRDPNVPFYFKLVPFITLIYVIWPIDIIVDVFPGLGQLDDITAILLGLKLFIELSPKDIVDTYLAELKGIILPPFESEEPHKIKGRIVIDESELD